MHLIEQTIMYTVNATGGIVVTSTNNDDRDACSYDPACSDYAITVGAYSWSHTRSSFSNYGECIDAWGPGTTIKSSRFAYGEYITADGTSSASPFMAGMIGQLLQFNPD